MMLFNIKLLQQGNIIVHFFYDMVSYFTRKA